MRFTLRDVMRLALLIGLAACNQPEAPVESVVRGGYHPATFDLVMYDVVQSPAGAELTLHMYADSTFAGRLWFPAPWAPFWGDTSSFELLLTGTWASGIDHLRPLAGRSSLPTDVGPGIYLHPDEPSFMTSMFLRVRHDTLFGRVQTYDEPGPINDIYLDVTMVHD